MDRTRTEAVDLAALIQEADAIAQAVTGPWQTLWAGDPRVTCCAVGHAWTFYRAPDVSGQRVYHRQCLTCGRTQQYVG